MHTISLCTSATTVELRASPYSAARSPKQSPDRRAAILRPPLTRPPEAASRTPPAITLSSPRRTQYIAVVVSPSEMTQQPGSKVSSTMATSPTRSFCWVVRPSKSVIVSRKALVSAYRFWLCSFTTSRKVSPSTAHTLLLCLAFTVAVRGHPYTRAIAPKASPAPRVLVALPATTTSQEPSWSTKKWFPSLPSFTIASPAPKS
mmetsp:Transcript_131514/g.332178  ORF Transcript_131514/g.332178 Transcript_131514/m.332178 type:complete len:203 (-) Transcript_131514:404-1012(-)